MSQGLLDGLQVLDLGHDPAARAGRILSDLGASVTRVVPPGGDPLTGNVARAWNAGKTVHALAADDPALADLLARADIVFDTPGAPGVHHLDPSRAPDAVWVRITPFGSEGPRAAWRATDLGVMAASSNMYNTGDPDRAPVRSSEPTAYAHTGPEAAFAALTAWWTGAPQRVDVSMQEVVLVANMATPARFPQTGFRGSRRGANIGRTREIWPTLDGFVSFGLRGGKARVPSLELLSKLTGDDALDGAGLDRFQPEHRHGRGAARDRATDRRVLRVAHDAGAVRHRVRDEPHARTRELAARDLRVGPARGARLLRPGRRCRAIPADVRHVARAADGEVAAGPAIRDPRLFAPRTAPPGPEPFKRSAKAWAGLRILEFGSGAAGPDRDPLLRRARRDSASGGVEVAAGLPSRVRARAQQPARARGRADVRRAQRRQAQRHAQPEATGCRLAHTPPGGGVGRRGRGELRTSRECAASGSTTTRSPKSVRMS